MGAVISAVATVAAIIPGPWQIPAQIFLITSSVYGVSQAKKKAARELANQQAAQRAAYNASLKDRTITRIASDAPEVTVYGRARVGSSIVAVFTSGTRDEYKHLICVHAAHECDAYEEIYINGVALGTLDGSGFPIAGKYTASVRVKKHLGTASDPADATLISEVPTKWTSNSVLRGYCYSYIRLDLNEPEFQGGLPSVEVLLRGKKLFDVRTSTTAWSQNNALVIYDYLTSEMCGVPSTDLPTAQFITAANVCDEAETFGNKYTFNGTVAADQDQAKVLEQMAQSMAGSLVATTWDISAGKYIAPVLALTQSDIVGSIAIIPGTSEADLYNGVKGQYISSETLYVATDFKPYQNAAYVTADGGELWTNIDFPFTDAVQRVHNLARIFAEDQRNGYTVKAGFSLKAWDLKIGQRVTLTSTLFGWSSKIFRVTDKTYSLTSPVELTLKEDAASIWDYADAVTADSTPNTGLPDPFLLALPTNVNMVETLYETTGSAGVKAKATLTWDAPAAIVTNYIVEYKLHADSSWIKLINVNGLQYDFLDIAPGYYDFRVAAQNFIGGTSAYTGTRSFNVYGLTAPPASMSGFTAVAMAGMCFATWTLTTDLDVKIGGKVQIRRTPLTSGAAFYNGVVVQELPGDAVSAFLPLATGTYMAKFIDSTGNFSATEATFVVTEALVSGWTTVVTSTQHATFTGSKTDCVVSGSNLIFTGTPLVATYAYAATIDCGSVLVRRYHSHIKANAYVASDLISARGLISTWASIASTAVVNGCDAYQEIRVSDDAATWSAWTKFNVADFSGRYAQVRLQMARDTSANNIEIQELTTTVKVPT